MVFSSLSVGVYTKVFGHADIFDPTAPMSFGTALVISLVGMLVVFVILGVIAAFVKALGFGFDRLGARRERSRTHASDIPYPEYPAAPETPTRTAEVILNDVTEEEAALVMAIVASRSDIPANRLQFNYIRRLEDGKE